MGLSGATHRLANSAALIAIGEYLMKCRSWTSRGVHVWKNGRMATATSGPLGQGEKATPILTLVMKMEQTRGAPFAGVSRRSSARSARLFRKASSSPKSNRREVHMSDTVRIIEMGARDGLQNEKTPVSVANRIAFIERLLGAGLHTIEVGAFVSPKAIPQMVGSDEVVRGVKHLAGEFHVLVP